MSTHPQHIAASLVGRHHELYHSNAHFHHAIDHLAAMLPAMVNGLADQAVAQQGITDERIRLLGERELLLTDDLSRERDE